MFVQNEVRPWASLGRVLGRLRQLLGRLGRLLGCLGHILGCLGRVLGPLGRVLGRSWALLGESWAALGRLEQVLSRLGQVLGASWIVLGGLGGQNAILEDSCTFSSHFRSRLRTRKLGTPPPKSVFGVPWGRLRGGIPKGYRRNLTA